MKRFLAFLMAMVMCMGMSSVAFAANIPVDTTMAAPEQYEEKSDDGWIEMDMSAPSGGISPQTIGGTETWNLGQDWSSSFTFYGTNLTPVKTIGATGKLELGVVYNSSTPVKLIVQARKAYTNEVLFQWTTSASTYYENVYPPFSVQKGQQIQLFFKVLDKNGNYNSGRALTMSYGYRLMA